MFFHAPLSILLCVSCFGPSMCLTHVIKTPVLVVPYSITRIVGVKLQNAHCQGKTLTICEMSGRAWQWQLVCGVLAFLSCSRSFSPSQKSISNQSHRNMFGVGSSSLFLSNFQNNHALEFFHVCLGFEAVCPPGCPHAQQSAGTQLAGVKSEGNTFLTFPSL